MRLRRTIQGFTVVELLVIVAVIAVLALILLPKIKRDQDQARRTSCVGRLKNISLGARIFATDHGDRFPWETHPNLGTNVNPPIDDLVALYLMLTNELSSPGILFCPADMATTRTDNWLTFGRTNISYFLGVNSSEAQPQSFLAGDYNLVFDGKPLPSGLSRIKTNASVAIDKSRHIGGANAAMGDGSIQRLSQEGWSNAMANTGLPEMHLNVP